MAKHYTEKVTHCLNQQSLEKSLLNNAVSSCHKTFEKEMKWGGESVMSQPERKTTWQLGSNVAKIGIPM